MKAELFWHCANCGNHESAQPEYEHGASEPCVHCPSGVSRVMTLQEAAAVEQRFALRHRDADKASELLEDGQVEGR